MGSKSGRARIIGDIPSKSKMHVSSGRLPLKSRNIIASKLPTRAASLLNKTVSSRIVTEALMQKEHVAPQFLSLLAGKGKMIKSKTTKPLFGEKVRWKAEEANRLTHAQVLQLFQTLLKEPLPFLELHGRFGVSKQAVKRLVMNRLLTETWGPKAVGVKFKLSNKGKNYLKELEAASRYEPKMRKKALIRLKHMASL